MSIFNPNGRLKTNTTPVEQDRVVTATVNNKDIPLGSLVTHVSGYPWTVNAYQGVYGAEDEAIPFNITLDATLQQYKKIEGLVIKVTSPLTTRVNNENQTTAMEGSALVHQGIPKFSKNDILIADVGNGRLGMFTITEQRALMQNNESLFEITYTGNVIADSITLPALEKKVIETNHYVADYLRLGRKALLSSEEMNNKALLNKLAFLTLDYYCRDFFNDTNGFLLLPEQPEFTFDYYLSRFIERNLEITRKKDLFNTNWPFDPQRREYTLWDMLDHKNALPLSMSIRTANKHLKVLSTRCMSNSLIYTGLFYGNVKRVVGVNTTNATSYNIRSKMTESRVIDDQVIIHPVTIDDFYVLSSHFYDNNRKECSLLELLTLEMIENKAIPIDKLLFIVEDSFNWEYLERFYYVPILLKLMKYINLGDLR